MKILGWVLVVAPIAYMVACSGISASKSRAFDGIEMGDRRIVALDGLGKPDVAERPGVPFTRYASRPCQGPCVERLWFENKLSLDTEAWSVDLDQNGRVIHKAYWASP